MTPSLSNFNFAGPSEPLDATTYCILFSVTVFCFWKFQEVARLHRSFVQCATEPTQWDQLMTKLMEYTFLFLTYTCFEALCQNSEGFVFTAINSITFFVFVYIYLENMNYISWFRKAINGSTQPPTHSSDE